MAYIHQISVNSISTTTSDQRSVVSVFFNFLFFHCKGCWRIDPWARREELYWDNEKQPIPSSRHLKKLMERGMKPNLSRWRPTCAWKHRGAPRHHQSNSFGNSWGDHLFAGRDLTSKVVAARLWRAKERHLLDYVVDERLSTWKLRPKPNVWQYQ